MYPEDKVPWRRTENLVEYVSGTTNSDGSVTLKCITNAIGSGDQNRFAKLNGGVSIDTTPWESTVTFVDKNGVAKLSKLVYGKPVTTDTRQCCFAVTAGVGYGSQTALSAIVSTSAFAK